MGVEPNWQNWKKLAADPNFKSHLLNYDKENMPDEILEELERRLMDEDFRPERIAKASLAASSLANWVIAIKNYGYFMREIAPQKIHIERLEEELKRDEIELLKLEGIDEGFRVDPEATKNAGLLTYLTENGKHNYQYQIYDEDDRIEDEHQDQVTASGFEEDDYLADYEHDGRGPPPDLENESLYFITNEIKKKDQSKKLVLWESNELRNQWDEKPVVKQKVESTSKTNSHQWTHENRNKLKSEIDSQKTKGKGKPAQKQPETGDSFQSVPKKDHQINNVFLQHSEQEERKKKQAPWSHGTFNKMEKPKKYEIGRPLFEGVGSHVSNINAGRDRIFYSSNIF